jgi:hypothetical protein
MSGRAPARMPPDRHVELSVCSESMPNNIHVPFIMEEKARRNSDVPCSFGDNGPPQVTFG